MIILHKVLYFGKNTLSHYRRTYLWLGVFFDCYGSNQRIGEW